MQSFRNSIYYLSRYFIIYHLCRMIRQYGKYTIIVEPGILRILPEPGILLILPWALKVDEFLILLWNLGVFKLEFFRQIRKPKILKNLRLRLDSETAKYYENSQSKIRDFDTNRLCIDNNMVLFITVLLFIIYRQLYCKYTINYYSPTLNSSDSSKGSKSGRISNFNIEF